MIAPTATIDFAAPRNALIAELVDQGIRDVRVLAALAEIPREIFLEETFIARAYDNIALPIKQGQTISQPYIVAAMTEALELTDRHKTLEIGTGSGYHTTVLARLCRRVYSLERYRSLLQTAASRFKALAVNNVTAMVGDGYKGWPEQAPFDRIIITACAIKEPPSALIEQLKVGGIMIVPIEIRPGDQILRRIRKSETGKIENEDLMPTRFVPLVEGLATAS